MVQHFFSKRELKKFVFGWLLCLFAAAPLQGQETLIFEGLKLPKAGYAAKLLKGLAQEKEVEGITVTVRVIADQYRYAMATGIEELQKSGFGSKKLEAELLKLHKKSKKVIGRVGFKVNVSGDGRNCHYFLTKKISKHLSIKGGGKLTGKVAAVTPKLRFVKWTIFQGASMRKMQLAPYSELSFYCQAKLKKGKNPIDFILKDLFRYRDNPNRNQYDAKGINHDTKQISLARLSDLAHPDVAFRFYPGKWKLPKAPKGFEELLARLASGKKGKTKGA